MFDAAMVCDRTTAHQPCPSALHIVSGTHSKIPPTSHNLDVVKEVASRYVDGRSVHVPILIRRSADELVLLDEVLVIAVSCMGDLHQQMQPVAQLRGGTRPVLRS
jgi:hypothetical protein